jgi:hypothetical protein
MEMDILKKIYILLIAGCLVSSTHAQYSDYQSRDSCMSVASTYCYAVWTANQGNCDPTYNHYTVGQITMGIDYQWGGYDTLSAALNKLNAGAIAGNSYPRVYERNPNWSGVDCSGYVSQCWLSGRYQTSNFYEICTTLSYADLYKGDITNYAGKHCRLFDHFSSGTNYLVSYECTEGVYPGRVVHRVLARDNHYVPMRYLYITPFNPPTNVNNVASNK